MRTELGVSVQHYAADDIGGKLTAIVRYWVIRNPVARDHELKQRRRTDRREESYAKLLRLAPTLTEYKRIALDWEDSPYCESEPSYIAIVAANELKGIGVPPEFIDSSPREVIILDESSSESKTKVATNTRLSGLSLIALSSFINP